MEINDATRGELLYIADELRALKWRMNAIYKHGDGDITQISNMAYGHVDHALSDVLAVLTDGMADGHLQHKVMLDCPDESTAECIRMWKRLYN